MDKKIQHCQDISSSQLDQCNPNQNPRKLFYKNQQTDSKTQNNHHNTEGQQKLEDQY